jgi:hypothetical protein
MNLFVAGSRKYPEPQEVIEFLHQLAAQMPDTILVTGKNGIVADTAEETAKQVGLELIGLKPTEVNPTHYEMTVWAYGDRAQAVVEKARLREITSTFDSFGKCAAFRSMYGIKLADRLVAFWDGQSPGTSQEIEWARVKAIPISLKCPRQPMQSLTP